jgi:hypothetical protein
MLIIYHEKKKYQFIYSQAISIVVDLSTFKLNLKNYRLSLLGTTAFAALLTVLGLAPIALMNSVAAQHQQQFIAKLSGSDEVPPVKTLAVGTAKFTVGANDKSLNYIINITTMNGVMGVHIQGGKQGENGPIIAGLFNPGMLGPPTGKVNGLLAKGNITSSNIQGTLPGKQISDLVSLMKSNATYVNIHTQQHQNGEIRGQIAPAS